MVQAGLRTQDLTTAAFTVANRGRNPLSAISTFIAY